MIPIMKAKLPLSDDIIPYLKAIDRNGTYTNSGPLFNELKKKVGHYLGVTTNAVLPVSSCTSGLQVALIYYLYRTGSSSIERPLVLTPSWSFPATSQAIIASGCIPVLCDTDEQGCMTSEIAFAAINRLKQVPALVLPVIPFGADYSPVEWESFSASTKIPVVIDAAASFFNYVPSNIVTVISTHATKGFSTGEGGLIVSNDLSTVAEMHATVNFGFMGARVPKVVGINAKLSEYSAAVGLASVDMIDDYVATIEIQKQLYRSYSQECGLAHYSSEFNPSSKSSVFNILLNDQFTVDSGLIGGLMQLHGIEVRSWWGDPISCQPVSKFCTSLDIPNSSMLSKRLLGIPFGFHLSELDISHICTSVLSEILKQGR